MIPAKCRLYLAIIETFDLQFLARFVCDAFSCNEYAVVVTNYD